ncbi:MAG: DUF1801 domain-containing protein [Trueperaceae bacterium]
MTELKTKPTADSVNAFLARVEDDQRSQDCLELLDLLRDVTKEEPKMWGSSMVGFGSYHYRYASGHEGDTFLTGFSPRKRNLTLYMNCDMSVFESEPDLTARLGKFKSGKGCLYLNKLDDVDRGVLRTLVERSVEHLRSTYC